MSSHLFLAVLATFCLLGCGDESQSNRTAEGEPPTIKKKQNNAEQKTTSKSENKVDPEDLAKKLEEQGLTNGGSPLVAINLSQGATIIPVGAQTFWLATGLYEDDSERNLTELVVWGSTDSNILQPLPDDPGGIKAGAQGNANLTVKLGTISSSAAMTVIP